MALFIVAPNPRDLSGFINPESTKVASTTWPYEADGDFTHTASSGQWTNRLGFGLL
jgi:hypothetical protein